MTVGAYLETLPDTDKEILNHFRHIVLAQDQSVIENIGKMMRLEQAILFNEQSVFKYALTRTKSFFSFHSMVLYGNPKLKAEFQAKLPKLTFQQSCINFKTIPDFPPGIFEDLVKQCAAVDYIAIIEKYKKKRVNAH